MSTQGGCRLEDLLAELLKLRGKLEEILPSHTAALNRLPRIPVEFDRRYWVSRVDLLLGKIKGEYERYQAEVNRANLVGRFMTVAIDAAMKMGGLGPMPAQPPMEACIAISSSGEVKLSLRDAHAGPSGAVLLTFQEFEKLALRLKDNILKGLATPNSDDEIPKMIRDLALGAPEHRHEAAGR